MRWIKFIAALIGLLVTFIVVASVAIVAIILVYGWLWALRVLTGHRKVGPRETWNDEQARRELKARRVEVKVASAILALYAAALFVTVVMCALVPSPSPVSGAFQTTMALLALAAIVCSIFPGMYLGLMAEDEWDWTAARLQRRLNNPVLF